MTNSNEFNKARRRPRPRVRFDGVIEESTVMGRVFTIPANPRRKGFDLSLSADGWEPLRTYLPRLRS